MTRARQEKQQEAIKAGILAAARGIISREGVAGLSIRKITSELEYSPAIIYHYFRNKDDILAALLRDGYGRILAAIQSVPSTPDRPDAEIRAAFGRYLAVVLADPEEFKAILLSTDPAVLARTAVLHRGVAGRSPSIGWLAAVIERGMQSGRLRAGDPELTAQILWSATFGLTVRLALETDVDPAQRTRLIDRHFDLLFQGLLEPAVSQPPEQTLTDRKERP